VNTQLCRRSSAISSHFRSLLYYRECPRSVASSKTCFRALRCREASNACFRKRLIHAASGNAFRPLERNPASAGELRQRATGRCRVLSWRVKTNIPTRLQEAMPPSKNCRYVRHKHQGRRTKIGSNPSCGKSAVHASPSRSSILRKPHSSILRRACANIRGEMSMPITRPGGPTRRAASIAINPVPVATSRTV
jgi:hypothetical protein